MAKRLHGVRITANSAAAVNQRLMIFGPFNQRELRFTATKLVYCLYLIASPLYEAS